MKFFNSLILLSAVALLSACGGGSESANKNALPCVDSDAAVDWDKLLLGNAEKLSEYHLFSNTCDPSKSASERGLPYDLTVALFTDYASKYRFVFIPENKTAVYDEKETFDFPVGTVITKTFTMPANTAERGISKEKLIETRLLIKRQDGWIARPYVWNDSGTEAFWVKVGKDVPINNLQHGNTRLSFTYSVPNQNSCLTCHQFNPNGIKDVVNGVDPTPAYFKPIGPKARYLNSDYDYGQGLENQLNKWVEKGLLSGLPSDTGSIQKSVKFNDNLTLSEYSGTQEILTATAKAWLDINCGHCHRPEGQASNTAFRADYNTPWVGNERYHGACEVPVSGASAGSTKIIVPGNASTSLLYNRIHTTEPGLIMPALGRSTIHAEGSALIKAWIESLASPICN